MSLKSFTTLTILFSAVALQTANAEMAAPTTLRAAAQQIIDGVQAEMDQQEWTLVAGYPYCKDVMNRRGEENEKIIKRRLEDPELIRRFDEMDYKLPNAYFRAAQAEFSDTPAHPVQHWRDRPAPSFSDGCFTESVPVVLLVGDKAESKSIMQIYRGQYILASTKAMFTDKRYQKDCWTEVVNIIQGEVKDEEKTTLVEYETSSGAQCTVEATPGHRFYCEGAQSWEWKKAAELQPGDKLQVNCEGESCAVKSNNAKTYDYGFWHFLSSDEQVYNLSTDAHTFYVGPVESKVLVHNVW